MVVTALVMYVQVEEGLHGSVVLSETDPRAPIHVPNLYVGLGVTMIIDSALKT